MLRVDLSVGGLCDADPSWLRRYFATASRGGPAEGAELSIQTLPAVAVCGACGASFPVVLPLDGPIRCERCGSPDFRPDDGATEYRVERIEVADSSSGGPTGA